MLGVNAEAVAKIREATMNFMIDPERILKYAYDKSKLTSVDHHHHRVPEHVITGRRKNQTRTRNWKAVLRMLLANVGVCR